MAVPTLKLNNGCDMPSLGLGTWLHDDTGNQMRDAVVAAAKMGYRHFDCAHIYKNEAKMGEAFDTILNQGDLKREDLFIGGKLWCTDHRLDKSEAACRHSLRQLGLDYFDLFMVHWPSAFQSGQGDLPKGEDGRVLFDDVSIEETWKGMEKLVELGLTKAIGVCNFNSKQMKQILDMCSIKPAVLQIECNPRFNNECLRKFCVKNDIQIVAFSPFGSPDLPWGKPLPHILVDETLTRIADQVGKSTAQVVLKWQLQRGIGVIPKSIFTHELENNLDIVGWSLSNEQCTQIDALDIGERKIVPIVVLPDGTKEPRDLNDANNPFTFDEVDDE